MVARSLISRLILYLTAILTLAGISISAYPEKGSVLELVPKETLVCLSFSDPRDFSGKVADFVKSLGIPNTSNLNLAQLVGKMTGKDVSDLMDVEDAGFDMESDACIFWTTLSPGKFAAAVHVSSKEKAESLVRSGIGGVDKQYKGTTYGLLQDKLAWVFLEDVFVYSRDRAVIMDVIETHFKNKPSILQNEKYLASTEPLRTGRLIGYVALDEIASTFLPLLQSQAEKAKKNVSDQMTKQRQRTDLPTMNFDVAKIMGAEMDMGLWLLKQMRSYAVSLSIGSDGIWITDSLKFKSDSPICGFLKTRPRRLELIDYLPDDVCVAGGATLDVATIEKFNSIMFGVMMSAMSDKMAGETASELRTRYDAAVHEILSCLGDEIAFAMPTKSDKMMQRFIYILKIADEDKARSTIGDLDYIMALSRPFMEMSGMDFQMTEGPTQNYSGIQISSFQIDLSQMMNMVPNAKSMYPEIAFLWYAFLDDKMIYAMSQSSDTIKRTIDAIRSRKSSIVNSPGFEDVDIRLPEKSNMAVYISPAGYMNLMMGMVMGSVGGTMPTASMKGAEKPGIGFAVATRLDKDGIRNSTYFLAREIQKMVGVGINMGKMIQAQTQPRVQTREPAKTKE